MLINRVLTGFGQGGSQKMIFERFMFSRLSVLNCIRNRSIFREGRLLLIRAHLVGNAIWIFAFDIETLSPSKREISKPMDLSWLM